MVFSNKNNKNDNITLLSVYIAPGQTLKFEHLNKLMISNNIIIVGDLNAKNKLWGSTVNDYRGNLVYKFINQFDLICLNKGSATRLNYNGSLSHLDLALCSSNLGFKMNCDILDDNWGSDHYPLLVNLDLDISINIDSFNLFNYSKADWDVFYSILENDSSLQTPCCDVEVGYNNMLLAFKKARDLCIPKRCTKFKHKYSPFWSPLCSAAKANKKQAEKCLRKNNTVDNQIQFKKCRANFKRVLLNAKTKYWEAFCSGINKQTKLKFVWDSINRLKGKKCKSEIKIKDPEGNFVLKEALPEAFAQNFQKICANSNISKEMIDSRSKTVQDFLKNRRKRLESLDQGIKSDSVKLNEPFKLNELLCVLKTVNIKSSPGCDDIPFSFFKHSPKNVLSYVLNIFNISWDSNKIPLNWKTSNVKPILKSNKVSSDISSYRPISLTSSFCKLIEKMITVRLSWFLNKNHLLNPNQAGFRKSFSTCDPIIRLSHEAEFAVSSGNYTVAIMIDFTCAFDLLWIDGLLIKMAELNISGKFFNWIKFFLTNRTNRVQIGNFFSKEYIQENGTPQGSSLSPILFLIMVNDFPVLSDYTYYAFFADDCTVWRSGENLPHIVFHLQQDVNVVSCWCSKWGLKINTLKTMGIIFSNREFSLNDVVLDINGNPIIFLSSVKMLGIVFDSHMTWKAHIDSLVAKSVKGLNLIRCICGTNWGSNKATLLTIYKSVILSSLDYCCFTYFTASSSILKTLDSIQYKSLSLAAGAIKGTSLKALLGECADIPLALRRKKYILNYLLKLNFYSNNSAREVLSDKKYFQLGLNCKSKYKLMIEEFLISFKISAPPFVDCQISPNPWSVENVHIDLSFRGDPSKISNTVSLNSTVSISNIIENLFLDFDHIFFVDGSVKADGRVGIGVFCPTLDYSLKVKLPDNLQIYFVEGYAILQALIYAKSHSINKFCIISDNAKVVSDLCHLAFESSPNPLLLQSIVSLLPTASDSNDSTYRIIWLPSSSDCFFFHFVDSLASKAASLTSTTPLNWTWQEVVPLTDRWMWRSWMKDWGERPDGSYQSTYSPSQSKSTCYMSRRFEIIANRIKLLQSKLNGCLFKVGLHPDGKCSTCGVMEDNHHFLMNCVKTEDIRCEIKKYTDTNPVKWSYGDLTINKEVLNIVVKYIISNNINF